MSQNNTLGAPPAADDVAPEVDRAATTANNNDGNNASSNSNTQSNSTSTGRSRRGIFLRTVKPGDNTNYPRAGDTVRTHYEAYLRESGEKVDSSRDRGGTFLWKVGHSQVIEGMDAAIVRMSKGQIAEVAIPYEFAYGEQGYPPVIPPKSSLIFELELIDISTI